jgi:glycosyltransferase involved in cell wall biosynthesis
MPIRASLIVTTYNWPSALRLVLESALAQNTLPAEVLVADDGSGPDTAALIAEFVPRFAERGVPMTHLWHADDGYRLAEIRNRAIAAATSEYLLLVDGDCVLHRDFVNSHIAFARRGTWVQGTRVLMNERRSADALQKGRVQLYPWSTGIRNRANTLSLPLLRGFVVASTNPMRGMRGANMAMWRDDVIRVNGFNEAFVGWGREDSEFAARMLAARVTRRKLKFGGIVYHLWHNEQKRDQLDANHQRFEETLRSGSTWAARGLDRHLVTPVRNAAVPNIDSSARID